MKTTDALSQDCHCERKPSIHRTAAKKAWIASSLSLLAMTAAPTNAAARNSHTPSHSRDAFAPEWCMNVSPPNG
jgi:hypothetical protein